VISGELVSESGVELPGFASAADPPATVREPPRDRAGGRDDVDVDAPADDVSEPEPVDPGDPVVSAKATGMEAIAEPTPSTTARAPTRPT
jgi:hypothetical protein